MLAFVCHFPHAVFSWNTDAVVHKHFSMGYLFKNMSSFFHLSPKLSNHGHQGLNITFLSPFCLNIPKTIMTQKSKEFMMDKFVMLFIVGEATGFKFFK